MKYRRKKKTFQEKLELMNTEEEERTLCTDEKVSVLK